MRAERQMRLEGGSEPAESDGNASEGDVTGGDCGTGGVVSAETVVVWKGWNSDSVEIDVSR